MSYLFRFVVGLFIIVGVESAGWAQDVPSPPRCGHHSIQDVSKDGKTVSIAVATPTLFENGNKIPANTVIVLAVFQSTDGGKTFARRLPAVSGGKIRAKDNQPQRLDIRVTLLEKVKPGEPVFLAVSAEVNDQSSELVSEFLSFRQLEKLERYRTPSLAKDTKGQGIRETERLPRYRFTKQQSDLIKRFGAPDFFEVSYLRFQDDKDKEVTDRLERWFYLANRTEICFVNGKCSNSNEIVGVPQVRTKPLYDPAIFTDSLKVAQALEFFGKEKLKKLGLKKLGFKAKLFQDLDIYLAKGLVVGFKKGQLLYVRSQPNWPSSKEIEPESKVTTPVNSPTGLFALASSGPAALATSGFLTTSRLPTPLKRSGIPLEPKARFGLGGAVVATAGLVTAASVGYNVIGHYGDAKNVGLGLRATANLYLTCNEMIESERNRINAALESGLLNKAEHQRVTAILEVTTESLTEARDELYSRQRDLTAESFALGVGSVAMSAGTSITKLISRVTKQPALLVFQQLLGNYYTYLSNQRTGLLSDAEIEKVLDSAEQRIRTTERNRYNEGWIKHYIRSNWNVWDDEASRNPPKITLEQRNQNFYDLVDQLESDGWHVPQGVESLALDTIRAHNPEEMPEPRKPDRGRGIVAKGRLSEDSRKKLEEFMLTLAKAFALEGKAPVKATLTSEEITLTVSPDSLASVSSGQFNADILYTGNRVEKSRITIAFENARGDSIEMRGEPVEGKRFPVKSVTGTGKIRTNRGEVQSIKWKAIYFGYDIWKMKVIVGKPTGNKMVLPDKYSLMFDLEEVKG